MKNLKKILACVMAVATLSSMSIIGVSAISEDISMIRLVCDENGTIVTVVSPNGEEFPYRTDDGKVFSNFDEDENPVYVTLTTVVDIIKEAIIILEDAGENSGTYYYNYKENEFPVKVDDTFDTSKVETVITLDNSLNGTNSKFITVYAGWGYGYTNMLYDYEMNTWLIQESSIGDKTSIITLVCDENGTIVTVVSPSGEEFPYRTDDGKIFSNFDEDENPVYVTPTTAVDVDILKENSFTEAIFIINDGEYSKEYYLNVDYMPYFPFMELDNDRNIIQHGDITDEKFNEVTSSVDISKVENVVRLDNEKISFYLDCDSYYVISGYDTNSHSFYIADTIIEKENTTIGESTSITEFTVGESTYPRGDINLDGKVNTVDLLMLKKYLLGLMEW